MGLFCFIAMNTPDYETASPSRGLAGYSPINGLHCRAGDAAAVGRSLTTQGGDGIKKSASDETLYLEIFGFILLHMWGNIHYNPVKHGLVKAPIDWEYSSFRRYVQRGKYPADWGTGQVITFPLEVGQEEITRR